jgi:hypothetical protein
VPPDSDPSEEATRTAAAGQPVTTPAPAAWGHLRIVDELGAGAYGRVYRAWDDTLAREVALKIIRLDRSDPATAASILQEGQMLARVRHRNVVTIYGAQEIAGEFGFWMELIRGRPLTRMIQDDGPLGAEEAAVIGISLCDALAAVHAAGVLHRDVKAQNVMRESGGRIVLMDFGAGRDLFGGREGWADMAGTPIYMAPEVLSGGQWTPAADVYSLGVLLYFLVTGRYPVEGRNVTEIALAYALGQQRLLADARPGLPDGFVRVVERALAAQHTRYRSAGAMMHDLAEVSPGAPGSWRERLAAEQASTAAPTHVAAAETSDRAAAPDASSWARPMLLFGTAVLAVWLLGFLTSMAFNQALGRTGEFANDTVLDWLAWGVRSLVGPALYVVLLLLAYRLVRFLCRAIEPAALARLRARLTERLRAAGVWNRGAAAQWLLAGQFLAVAVFCWVFRDYIAAYTSLLDTAPASAVNTLRSGDTHVLYRWALSGLLVIMAVAWYHVLIPAANSRAVRAARIDRTTVAAGFGIMALVAVLLDVPYRLAHPTQFQRADFNGQQCLVVEESDSRVLLFCPNDPPRSRVVAASDPALERLPSMNELFRFPFTP